MLNFIIFSSLDIWEHREGHLREKKEIYETQ